MSSTGQGSPFFSPTQISGCQLWLDAADSSTLTLTASTVTTWRDKSGNGRNATAPIAPTLVQGIQNKLPAIYFNGASYFTGSLTNTTNQQSFFAVFRYNTGAPQYARLASFGVNLTADFNNVAYYNMSYNTGTLAITRNSIETGVTLSPALDTFHQASVIFNGTNGLYYTDGGSYSNSAAWTANFNFNQYRLGSDQTPFVPQQMIGYIAEVIVYSGGVTTQQRQQVEGYLAWKWGLQGNLPATHPYKSSPYPPFVVASVPTALANNFQPPQVSGLALWLDASDPTTITGSSPITGWADKSGTGKTVTFVGADNTYSSDAQSVNTSNGTAGAATYFYANVNLKRSVVPNVSVFLVYTWTGSGISANQPLWGQDNGGGWNRFQLLSFPSASALSYGLSYTPSSPNVTVASSLNTANKLVYTATYALNAPNGTFVNVNGSLASSLVTEVPASPETSTTNTYFGTIDTGYSGRVAYHEILIYTANLTVVQRQQVEGYLAWKWSLTSSFSSTFPYKTIPPSLSPLPIYPRSIITPGVWNPTQVSGCSLWLDAADQSTLTLGPANTVSRWRDKISSLSFQASATNPTLYPIPFNRNYPIQFSGSSFFLNSAFTYGLSSRSCFLVVSETTPGNNNGFLSFAVTGTDYTQTNALAIESGSKTISQYYQIITASGNGGYVATLTGQPATPFAIYSDTFGSGVESVYQNGTLATTATSSQTFTSSLGLYVGARMVANSVSNYLTGLVAEVILYNRALTASERQQAEGYLAWKWGLQKSLPANHPWANWPPPPS